ncbi:MAG: hypothetical protein ACI9RO_001781, partial [Alteromonas macleodii]
KNQKYIIFDEHLNGREPRWAFAIAPSNLFPVFGPAEQTLDTAKSLIALFSMSDGHLT